MHTVDAHKTGWQAWGAAQADQARLRYAWHLRRGDRDRIERDAALSAKGSARSRLSAST
jgi:electron transport complex protein RnfB